MSELKPRITENGIDYILVGDYYIPDLKLPEEHRPIGKYGRMHREYLREAHPARLNTLTLTGELFTMKKIGLGIAILLFAIIISLCSSGMGLLVIGIGIVGLIFSIIGFIERK